MPSGPGWFWARVSTMNAWFGGTSSPLPGMPSGPAVISGSSGLSGTKTVEPLLTVWSTPWSKNWPKNVKSELYGGERPTSVVTFGMKSVLCDGMQPSGTPSTGGTAVGFGSVVHGSTPLLPWVRTGWPAAATAAGFVEVWSTIRLLIDARLRVEDVALSSACSDDGPGGPKPGGTGSASRKFFAERRGKTWSAAAKVSRPGEQVVAGPVDRAQTVGGQPVRDLVGVRDVVARLVDERVARVRPATGVAACCSAMLICLRMNFRSPVVTVKPWPVGGVAALARLGRTEETATTATSAMRNSIAETATVR